MVPDPLESRKSVKANEFGDQSSNGHRPVNYRELAPVYLRQGYPAPIPLPQGRKHPPPNGFTGHHNTQPPSSEQIEEWREKRGDYGIAVVAQDGELWIDVDNYEKGDWPAGTGVATMADAQEVAGCALPPGPKLRNRTDGSEKRPFRVPTGLKFKKSLGPCVDIVTPTHRYVNAGINPDTGNPERWFDADDNPLDEPPRPETWPELPEAWVRLLIRDHSDGLGQASFATEEQAQAWLNGMPEGPIGCLVREEMDLALAGLNGQCPDSEHGARHDCFCEHVRWIVEMGVAGLTGVPAALKLLQGQFVDAVKPDRVGGVAEAEHEFDSFVDWGARVCRPDVFYALKALEHIGYEGWAPKVIDGLANDEPLASEPSDERTRRIEQIADKLEEQGEARRLVSERRAQALIDVNSDRFTDGWTFLTSIAETQALWGEGERVLWAPGEGLMIVGPQGVGKSTVVQQLVLARMGLLGNELFGYLVEPDDRPILYLAMDRPRQIARSMLRMIDTKDRERLSKQLIFWDGRPPIMANEAPEAFAKWVARHGCNPGMLINDSVKDMCSGLTGAEDGIGFNAAIQEVIRSGTEVVSLHHQRKANADNKKPDKLADVYGSNWLTAGQGSVLLLWGEPGAKLVELSHLKQPQDRIPPLIINHEHGRGESAATDPYERVIELATTAGDLGITEEEAVRAIFDIGKLDDGYDNAKKSVRRRLDKLVSEERLDYTAGSRGGAGGGGIAARWTVTSKETG